MNLRTLSTTFILLATALSLAGCAADSDDPAEDPSEVDELTAQDVRTTLAPLAFRTSTSMTNAGAASAARHGDHLVMNLPFAPVAALRGQLDAALGGNLKHSGEAHVTVITPPEAQALAAKVSVAEMHTIAAEMQIQSGT